jgi:hypothetical protein
MGNTALATKPTEGTDVAIYNPAKGLQTIAVAEAAEKHWRKARDFTKLFEAIEAKIKAQAEYVCWRDTKVIPSQERGGTGANQHKGARIETDRSELTDADPGNDIAYRWRKKLCALVDQIVDGETKKRGKGRKTRTVVDDDKLLATLDDAKARCARVVEQQPKGTERGTGGTGEFERYTPAPYIEAARRVLGTIDVDPASNQMAQETVKAEKFYTVDDSGLESEWHGNIWLNPPYHRALQPLFVDKLVAEIEAGHVKQAIMLTNNSTDTEWFRIAAEASTLICFTNGRVGFTTPTGEAVAPTQGQTFFYFGDNPQKFADEFETTGFITKLVRNFAAS